MRQAAITAGRTFHNLSWVCAGSGGGDDADADDTDNVDIDDACADDADADVDDADADDVDGDGELLVKWRNRQIAKNRLLGMRPTMGK